MKYKIVYSNDYIAFMKGKNEILGWHEDEWKEDSSYGLTHAPTFLKISIKC